MTTECWACDGKGAFNGGPCDVCIHEGRIADPDAPSEDRRKLDRKRFPHPGFNEWLDTVISDCGHTVWDSLGDTESAWEGWLAACLHETAAAAETGWCPTCGLGRPQPAGLRFKGEWEL